MKIIILLQNIIIIYIISIIIPLKYDILQVFLFFFRQEKLTAEQREILRLQRSTRVEQKPLGAAGFGAVGGPRFGWKKPRNLSIERWRNGEKG